MSAQQTFDLEMDATRAHGSSLQRMVRLPSILDVTMGHRGMQREVRERFGIEGELLSVDIRPRMTNGMTPDMVADSRNLPLPDDSYDVVLFDPPFSFHGAKSCGNTEYNSFYVTYGLNLYTSRKELGDYLEQTFREIRRVLKPGGECLLKWSESRIKLDFPLAVAGDLDEARRWQRPSKHWGTKTGTATWYVWLRKPNDAIRAFRDRAGNVSLGNSLVPCSTSPSARTPSRPIWPGASPR